VHVSQWGSLATNPAYSHCVCHNAHRWLTANKPCLQPPTCSYQQEKSDTQQEKGESPQSNSEA